MGKYIEYDASEEEDFNIEEGDPILEFMIKAKDDLEVIKDEFDFFESKFIIPTVELLGNPY